MAKKKAPLTKDDIQLAAMTGFFAGYAIGHTRKAKSAEYAWECTQKAAEYLRKASR